MSTEAGPSIWSMMRRKSAPAGAVKVASPRVHLVPSAGISMRQPPLDLRSEVRAPRPMELGLAIFSAFIQALMR